jgi:glycosyltransferase involved in cell wall biosynthesis
LLPTLYSAADFAVFPSRYEPFGYVVAEALACGTPVIAAPGGASRLFLQEPPLDSLLMGDAADADRYAAATLEVLNDAQRYRQAVIEKARPRIVETMAQENWWSRFFKVTGL